MAAPTYGQIQKFAGLIDRVTQSALVEFLESFEPGMGRAEIREIAMAVAAKYKMAGSELGAQWYDLCARIAGIDVDPADLMDADEVYYEDLLARIDGALDEFSQGDYDLEQFFNSFLKSEIQSSVREAGQKAVWRDYYRGIRGGRWARVPVGETCAWCLMLASNGAWYVSEETALGISADHYHKGCDCVAVYYADAEQIAGYDQLGEYKRMFYEADLLRERVTNGKDTYPQDLQERISIAYQDHSLRSDKPWTPYNETLVVMRYQNNLEH